MKHFLISMLFICGFASSLAAQPENSKWAIGPHLAISFPQNEFSNFSTTGEGLGGKVLYTFPGFERIKPRMDITYLSYGEKRSAIGSIYYLATIRYESFQFIVGPEVNAKIDRFTLYGAALGGVYNYRTVFSIADPYYPYSDSDGQTKLGYRLQAGTLIDIGLGPHIDISFSYQTTPGVTSETGTGEESVKVKTDAEEFMVSVGVVFFLKEK